MYKLINSLPIPELLQLSLLLNNNFIIKVIVVDVLLNFYQEFTGLDQNIKAF